MTRANISDMQTAPHVHTYSYCTLIEMCSRISHTHIRIKVELIIRQANLDIEIPMHKNIYLNYR